MLACFLSRFYTVSLAACLPVLLHNGGFCNCCITKQMYYLQAFPPTKDNIIKKINKIIIFLLLSSFNINQP
jgi:hypothetical protein